METKFSSFKGKIITIDGCIGAGKSTLCKNLYNTFKSLNYDVKLYIEKFNNDMLSLFLSDMKKYAFMFQIYMLQQRRIIYEEAIEFVKSEGVAIIDRSMCSDIAFCLLHKDMGNISDEEWKTYNSVINEKLYETPDYIVYLDVTAEKCMERIKSRNRLNETDSYDILYLNNLIDKHKTVFKNTINVDWNSDEFNSKRFLSSILDYKILFTKN